ncbi:hypothetical protein D9M72_506740 [compost metagenome]
MRQPHPRGGVHFGVVHLAADHGHHVAHHHAHQDAEPPQDALEQHADQDDGGEGDRRGDGGGVEVVFRGRRQVQTDQGHNGTGDDGRHQAVDPAGPEFLDHGTDDGQPGARENHAAQCAGNPELLLGGHDRGNEGKARTEVAGHLALRNHQEEQSSNAGEEQCGGRRHAGNDGHQERGPEHGHHVLHSHPDGEGPGEPFTGCHHLTGPDRLSVAVKLPFGTKHAHGREPFKENGCRERGRNLPEQHYRAGRAGRRCVERHARLREEERFA